MKHLHTLVILAAVIPAWLSCSKDNEVQTRDVCAAGEYSCQVRTLRICNDSLSGWLDVETCGSGTRCDALAESCIPQNAGGSGGGSGGTAGNAGTGGSTGTGGADGGAGGKACSAQCSELEQCFNGQFCVAKLVTVPAPGGSASYQIDATEVTRSQYVAWTSTSPALPTADGVCSWKTSYSSGQGSGKHPVSDVDWCDAYSYCKGVGKRLCGSIAGGPNTYADADVATKSQWFNACSSEGIYNFPYGGNPQGGLNDGYQQQTCNGPGKGVGATMEVGTCPECASSAAGYSGVYDLSGNIDEWEDSCKAASGANDVCHIRGGAFYNTAADMLQCRATTLASTSAFRRNLKVSTVGFRCCSDP